MPGCFTQACESLVQEKEKSFQEEIGDDQPIGGSESLKVKVHTVVQQQR